MKSHQEYAIDYFQDEDGMFTAEVPAIRGCLAWGKTLREAHRNAVDAIERCLVARAKVAARKTRKPRYAGVNIYRRLVDAYTAISSLLCHKIILARNNLIHSRVALHPHECHSG